MPSGMPVLQAWVQSHFLHQATSFTICIMPRIVSHCQSRLVNLFPSLKEGAGGEQGGWRQVSCINTLSGSGSPQGALGCSSRSALSSHNPHDKYWCDSCISAASYSGVCGVLQVVLETGRDGKGLVGCGTLHANPCCLVVFRQAFARPQKRTQGLLCHNLLQWLAPRDVPALLAAMGNCTWKKLLSQQPRLAARTNQHEACSTVPAQDHCLQTSKRLGMLL